MVQSIPVIDVVQDRHVEQIIISGSRFISSIYGPGAHLVTADAIPIFFRNPIISGPEVIGEPVAPPLLTCEANSFSSSPRAVLTYQWQRDSVNINGETASTYVTVLIDIGTNITCDVTATNASGSDFATSNIIVVSALVPAFLGEMDVMTITALSDPGRATVSTGEISILSGLWHLEKVDINEADLYVMMGVSNLVKLDINELDLYAVSGSVSPAKVDILEADAYGVSGFVSENKIDIDEAGAYAMWVPVNLDDLLLINGDAENSSMSDWTMDIGNVQSVTTAPGVSEIDREGARFFKADSLGLGVDSQMSQEITIPAGDLTDIDTGRCYAIAHVIHDAEDALDHIEIKLEAIDANPTVIGTATHVFDSNPNPDGDGWRVESTLDNPLSIPTLTRTIKITVLFKANDVSGGPDNNGYLDDIVIELLKV